MLVCYAQRNAAMLDHSGTPTDIKGGVAGLRDKVLLDIQIAHLHPISV